MAVTVKHLRAAAAALADDPAYRKLGSADAEVGLRVDGKCYKVTFHAFRVADVKAIDARALRDLDFVITLPDWDAYLSARASGRGRTLMELDLDGQVISAPTPRQRLQFARYHLSIQAFIDALAAEMYAEAA